MGFKQLKILNFRNLKNIKLVINVKTVFFIGENGQGKTNLIESIYNLCFGSSFRTNLNQNLINDNKIPTYLSGQYVNKQNESYQIEILLYNKKKEIKINKKKISDRKDLIGIIPCILFSHEDMIYINGPSEKRRWFFDQTISLLEPQYINLLRKYNIVLKNRNLCLKNKEYDLISIYDEQLILFGLEIINKREKIVELYNHIFSVLFKNISELENLVFIKYISSWKNKKKDELILILKKKLNFDIKLKTTTSGPHRDKYHYIWKDKKFSDIASTGQIRLASITARLSQANMLLQYNQIEPILLVDDVLLELDDKRRKNFFKNLCKYDQAFFTFLPDFPINFNSENDVMQYNIKNGMVVN